MTEIKLTDKAPISGTRKTADGYLVAQAKVARAGIQEYRQSEIGQIGDGIVRVYRPEQEVFLDASMHTYGNRPVTLGHPPEMVSADTWREKAVGITGGEVVRDGEYVSVPILVMDADAVKAIEGGTRELSMGYTANIELSDGLTPDGEHYDAIQTGLKMNHVAIVPQARGGSELKIGDGEKAMADGIKTRTVMVDGLSVETTDAGAQAIEKLQAQLADMAEARKKDKADADKAMGEKDAEIDKLKDAQVSDADLDARVEARAALIADAKALAPEVVTGGVSDADIRKAVVAAKVGDMDGKTDEYIQARFDALKDAAPRGDQFADAMKAGGGKPENTLDAVYDERNAALANAWKKGA